MTNAIIALVALGLVAAKVFSQENYFKFNEYPSRVAVGEYGEVKFGCSRMECGNIQRVSNFAVFHH